MKLEHAETVIVYLAGAYMTELGVATIRAWTDQLVHLDYDTAMEAARAMIASDRRFMPLFGEFKVEYDIVARRRVQQARDAMPALAEESESSKSDMPSREEAHAYVQDIQAKLAVNRSRDRAMLGRRSPNVPAATVEHDPATCEACKTQPPDGSSGGGGGNE